ncbi:MAG: T9SS type B sorting domain-containing protein, partial [Sphingobacteriaceae bacterium]
NSVICSGTATGLEIQGTPNAIVSYTIGGVAQPDVTIPASGTYVINTGVQTVTATTTFTYALTNVVSNSTPPCSSAITGQSATLTVNALPTATFSAVSTNICQGTSAVLNFVGTPNATVTYTDGTQNFTIPLDGTGNGSATTATIAATTTFTLVSVEVTNTIVCSQALTGTVTITIKPNVAITSPLTDTTVTICPGESHTFSVTATGSGLTYQWYFNGTTPITAATGASYTINSAVMANAGDYTVVVSGECGTPVTSAKTTLVITTDTVITSQPSPTPQTVCEGTPITITIAATGTNLTYQWFKGTTPVNGATSPVLTINSTSVSDSGSYTCQITSGTCGTKTSNAAVLTVNQAPAITLQPSDVTICTGEKVEFKVVATGTNLTYQWFRGTTAIPGATSSTYTIPSAVEADSDTYYCTVTSTSCPSINSAVVTLLVKPLPFATIAQGNPSTICEGESTQVIFDGTAGAVVIYTINGGTPETITLNAGVPTILPTGTLTQTTIYELVSVTYPGVDACSQNLTGSATVTVNPLPSVKIEDGFICVDPVTSAVTRNYIIDTGLNQAQFTFEWSDANGIIPLATNSFYEASAVGQYGVTITDIVTGCKATAFATVDQSLPPTDFTYTVSGFFANNPTVVISATPAGNYEYQIDYGPFQESNIFDNLTAGTHTISVRDAQGCDVLTKTVLVIDYPRYFTPNGDGINDTWNIPTINNVSMSKIYIFDRFGKLIKEMTASGSGWDGTYNGQLLPAADYWFTINYQEAGVNKEFRAHFSLKR